MRNSEHRADVISLPLVRGSCGRYAPDRMGSSFRRRRGLLVRRFLLPDRRKQSYTCTAAEGQLAEIGSAATMARRSMKRSIPSSATQRMLPWGECGSRAHTRRTVATCMIDIWANGLVVWALALSLEEWRVFTATNMYDTCRAGSG